MRICRGKVVVISACLGIAASIGLPVTVMARNVLTGGAARGQDAGDHRKSAGESAQVSPSVKLASLRSSAIALPEFSESAVPKARTQDEALALDAADALRENGDYSAAAHAYIEVLDKFPNFRQVESIELHLNYMFDRLDETGLDEIEANLPAREALTSNCSRKALALFYYRRALRLASKNSERAVSYGIAAMDVSWDVLRDKLDDPFKSELLDRYLEIADLTGRGKQARSRLSKYADSIGPCFTSWLIKSTIDGEELPVDYVPSHDGKVAIRKHFMRLAKAAGDKTASTVYHQKARDVARELLLTQPADEAGLYLAAMYLKEAERAGDRQSAVAELEGILKSEPLSIMRWIIRSELAMEYVQPGRSEEDTRLGFAHFEDAVTEANDDVVLAAINDPALDETDRGILVCMVGHAYLGTNRVDESRGYYEWVCMYYPRISHAADSAAYSLIEVDARDVTRDRAEIAREFEAFADGFPGGPYSQGALMRAAQIYEVIADTDSARTVYERISTEYPESPLAREAGSELEKLRVQ